MISGYLRGDKGVFALWDVAHHAPLRCCPRGVWYAEGAGQRTTLQRYLDIGILWLMFFAGWCRRKATWWQGIEVGKYILHL